MDHLVCGKSLGDWCKEVPVVGSLMALEEAVWINPRLEGTPAALAGCPFTLEDILDASGRLDRFAPYLALAFPETGDGIIESPFREVPAFQQVLGDLYGGTVGNKLYLKMDSHLPISGSVKARGGIYEILKYAETLALKEGIIRLEDDYSKLMDKSSKDFFSRYAIAVSSTGNLGLSIGIISAMIGFRVTVHMSADARQWKKDLLREKGAQVIEYEGDYSKAVEEGRKTSDADPMSYFVDDENSKDLFLGYAVAGLRMKKQFDQAGIRVDDQNPLVVCIPCGVGGGPAGVAFGLKMMYGDAVHCFFAEPTHAPCMVLGLATGCHDKVSVQDFGIDGHTHADGLAVGRASQFAGRVIQPFLSGSYTITDNRMYELLWHMADSEGIRLEPSALAGAFAPVLFAQNDQARKYWSKLVQNGVDKNTNFLIWATGGSMVPEQVMEEYIQIGKEEAAAKILK